MQHRRLETYAVIAQRDYMKVMRKEKRILSERNPGKRLALIADASQWVGDLMRCPECGLWFFMKPLHGKESPGIVLQAIPATRRAHCTHSLPPHSTARRTASSRRA